MERCVLLSLIPLFLACWVGAVPLPMPPFRKRTDLASLLNSLQMKTAVEVGVKKGEFALHNLKNWPLNKEYWLVDLWRFQENYLDNSNKNNKEHEKNYKYAIKSLNGYKDKIKICRNYSTACANIFPDEYFDFVYIDARHDRKGSLDDLMAYWPKVKQGGIMAGHDFVSQAEIKNKQDWTKNYDGTIDESGQAVRGAVMDFFSNVSHPARLRTITVSYREINHFVSWAVRK